MANYSASPLSSPNAERARQVAAHFRDLQGLRQVPGGIWLLVLFAAEMVVPWNREAIRTMPPGQLLLVGAFVIGTFIPAAIAFKFISDWYARLFGYVEPTRQQRRTASRFAVSASLLIIVPLSLGQSSWSAYGQTWPANVVLFTMALWLVGVWWYLGRSLTHYLVLAAISLALGLVSIAGVPPADWPWHLREATLFLAVAFITSGLLDHRRLTHSLLLPGDPVGQES